MPTLGALITDAQLAERQPVTARLLRAMRGHTRSLGIKQFNIPGGAFLAQDNDTAFATLVTVPLYVPDSLIGDGGTKLTLFDVLGRAVPTVVIPRSQTYRLKIGADTGTEIINRGTGSLLMDLEITWTPSGNADVSVLIEGKVASGSNTCEASWTGYGIVEQVNA